MDDHDSNFRERSDPAATYIVLAIVGPGFGYVDRSDDPGALLLTARYRRRLRRFILAMISSTRFPASA